MQMDKGDARLLAPVTERIIGCAFRVANAFGHGCVEKVSEIPLPTRCESAGSAPSSSGALALYDDAIVGEFTANLLVPRHSDFDFLAVSG